MAPTGETIVALLSRRAPDHIQPLHFFLSIYSSDFIQSRFVFEPRAISSQRFLRLFEYRNLNTLICRASCRCCSPVHLSLARALFFPFDNSLSKLSPLCRNQTADAVSNAGLVIIHRSAEPITHYTTHTHTHTEKRACVYIYSRLLCAVCAVCLHLSVLRTRQTHCRSILNRKNIRRRKKRETHTSDNRSPLSDGYMALTLR